MCCRYLLCYLDLTNNHLFAFVLHSTAKIISKQCAKLEGNLLQGTAFILIYNAD